MAKNPHFEIFACQDIPPPKQLERLVRRNECESLLYFFRSKQHGNKNAFRRKLEKITTVPLRCHF